MGDLERQFLDASEALQTRQEQEAADRLRRERERSDRVLQLLLQTYVERGYELLSAQGTEEDGLLWLHRAYQQGSEHAALPYLLRRAMRAIDSRRAVIVRDSPVSDAAFSPDGRHVITITQEGAALVSDSTSGQPIVALSGPAIDAVSYSPDGGRIVAIGRDGRARIYNADTGTLERTLAVSATRSVRFAPDGHHIIAVDGTGALLLLNDNGAPAERLWPGGGVGSVLAYSEDGKRLLLQRSERSADLLERETQQRLAAFSIGEGEIFWAELCDNGRQILFVASDPANPGLYIAMLMAPNGAPLMTLPKLFGPSGGNRSARLSPDGNSLAVICGNNAAGIFRLGRGLTHTLKGHWEELRGVTYSPDGLRIATYGEDLEARIYNQLLDDAIVERPNADWQLYRNAWRVSDEQSPDGRHLLSIAPYNLVQVQDAKTFDLVAELSGHQGGVWSVKYSPNGNRIVTTSMDGTARIWDAQHWGSLAVLKGHQGAVLGACFAADGRQVVTVDEEGSARVFDVESGYLLAVLSVQHAKAVAAWFVPTEDSVVTVCDDGRERVWKVAPETRSAEVLASLIRRRTLVRFESPDGTATTGQVWR